MDYKNISMKDAEEYLKNDKSILLLDVRSKEEYSEIHMPNSILLPLDNIEREVNTKIPDKNTKIFVYCRSGVRSVSASKLLVSLGYNDVYNIGGIIEWSGIPSK